MSTKSEISPRAHPARASRIPKPREVPLLASDQHQPHPRARAASLRLGRLALAPRKESARSLALLVLQLCPTSAILEILSHRLQPIRAGTTSFCNPGERNFAPIRDQPPSPEDAGRAWARRLSFRFCKSIMSGHHHPAPFDWQNGGDHRRHTRTHRVNQNQKLDRVD